MNKQARNNVVNRIVKATLGNDVPTLHEKMNAAREGINPIGTLAKGIVSKITSTDEDEIRKEIEDLFSLD